MIIWTSARSRKGYKTTKMILDESFSWFSSKCWLQLGEKRKKEKKKLPKSERHLCIMNAIVTYSVFSESSSQSFSYSGAYLLGNVSAVLHLKDPELFAAYLKVLKHLVSKQNTTRSIQNVQVTAFC